MKIVSTGIGFFVEFPPTDIWHSWRQGSHTANVYHGFKEIDCYTFAWEKNETSMLDFTNALESYLKED